MPIYKPNKMVDAKFERLNTSTLESLQKSMLEKKDFEKAEVKVEKSKNKKCLRMTLTVFGVAVLVIALFLLKFLISYYHRRPFCMIMEVKYYDKQHNQFGNSFKEAITIDVDENFVKIKMPTVGASMMNDVVHDFEYNITAVVDHKKAACYITPLDQTKISKPKDAQELLRDLELDSYIKLEEVLNTYYSIEFENQKNLEKYGPLIKQECCFYDVFIMEKIIPFKNGGGTFAPQHGPSGGSENAYKDSHNNLIKNWQNGEDLVESNDDDDKINKMMNHHDGIEDEDEEEEEDDDDDDDYTEDEAYPFIPYDSYFSSDEDEEDDEDEYYLEDEGKRFEKEWNHKERRDFREKREVIRDDNADNNESRDGGAQEKNRGGSDDRKNEEVTRSDVKRQGNVVRCSEVGESYCTGVVTSSSMECINIMQCEM